MHHERWPARSARLPDNARLTALKQALGDQAHELRISAVAIAEENLPLHPAVASARYAWRGAGLVRSGHHRSSVRGSAQGGRARRFCLGLLQRECLPPGFDGLELPASR